MDQLARTPKDIGHAIREARKGQNLTQKDLAMKNGLWQETVSKIENGVSSTKLETLFDLLAALDLEIQIKPRSKGSINDLGDIF